MKSWLILEADGGGGILYFLQGPIKQSQLEEMPLLGLDLHTRNLKSVRERDSDPCDGLEVTDRRLSR